MTYVWCMAAYIFLTVRSQWRKTKSKETLQWTDVKNQLLAWSQHLWDEAIARYYCGWMMFCFVVFFLFLFYMTQDSQCQEISDWLLGHWEISKSYPFNLHIQMKLDSNHTVSTCWNIHSTILIYIGRKKLGQLPHVLYMKHTVKLDFLKGSAMIK